jgi:cytidylate kinase
VSTVAAGETLVVAIDGPAGSGKSTVARLVAKALGFLFLDTGAIYRALALRASRAGVAWDDGRRLASLARDMRLDFRPTEQSQRVVLDGEDVSEAIRTPEMSKGASAVSRHGPVREALLELQRGFGESASLVAEGRDVGTVVFPAAAVKVFLVADPEVRARRRWGDLQRAGLIDVPLEQVLREQVERDAADAERAVAPLRKADDAVAVDTSSMTIDQVVSEIVSLCCRAGGGDRRGEGGRR